ncbi:hypothetical protein DXG03_000913 [Asterophora parasitica]|uniref:Glutamyl/glutaminyl-tRNA synthetase class Ib catalytic domain-containing protein n=1 Tax=Asterophora parasitica TaxID=117018 RepID=A0A9P7KC26_9AGAR|nr:hypothetical protein DXG03_000913 [Asterophora parasitica]
MTTTLTVFVADYPYAAAVAVQLKANLIFDQSILQTTLEIQGKGYTGAEDELVSALDTTYRDSSVESSIQIATMGNATTNFIGSFAVVQAELLTTANQTSLAAFTSAKAEKARSGSKTASSFALGLQGAAKGQVVTRFPPEPSGYLHIGHAKAAMLNQYFAKMYDCKLITRFDHTNPSKEKTEFEETILEGLHLLGIQGDVVAHTSDYFDKLYELAVHMIRNGKAYADDTDNTTPANLDCACPSKQHGNLTRMAHERWHGIASQRRDSTVEENLARFEKMRSGTSEGLRWCIRAKISLDNPPVVYRTNAIPHHRTSDEWKIYPTYNFACPAVDSIEGVTHALRTNEYRDRNTQYARMLSALDLRPVNIWDFSRLNFVHTLLSKRKLHGLVDQGLVHGWDDPRPTVRGIRRRGLTVDALRQFMLSQGPF